MGMPDPQQQSPDQLAYAPPPVWPGTLTPPDPSTQIVHWAVSTFGASTVVLAMVVGAVVLWNRKLRKYLGSS